MLFASALLALIPPPVTPPPVIPPVQVPVERRDLSWPDIAPGPIVSAPEWGDYNVYPAAARALGQQGRVRSRVLVDAAGRVTDCVIVFGTGHADLDSGHCEVMRLVRFEPARIDGRPVASSRIVVINWQLGQEYPLGRAAAAADVSLKGGKITECKLAVQGPHFLAHQVSGCLPLNRNNVLLDSLPDVSRLRIEVELAPAGEAMSSPRERLILRRLVAFEIDGEGDAVNCRTLSEEGEVARLAPLRAGGCDDVLRSVWFVAPPPGETLTGLYEIRVSSPR
jgi:TonB family protein